MYTLNCYVMNKWRKKTSLNMLICCVFWMNFVNSITMSNPNQPVLDSLYLKLYFTHIWLKTIWLRLKLKWEVVFISKTSTNTKSVLIQLACNDYGSLETDVAVFIWWCVSIKLHLCIYIMFNLITIRFYELAEIIWLWKTAWWKRSVWFK